tara:strand:- start:10493 stop:11200 length:708 start_codon:yes stop_codon:yes gene_type:complete
MKGIKFYGSGGLLYYYMGIAEFIQKNYNLDNLEFCGVSGGSIPAFLLSTKVNIRYIWDNSIIPWIHNDISDNSPIFFSIFKPESLHLLLSYLNNIITHEHLIHINNSLSIKMTRITLFGYNQIYINNWESIQDVIECIVASCWIPVIFGNMSRQYRGEHYIDGGIPISLEDKGQSQEWINIRVNTFQNIDEDMKVILYAGSLQFINNTELANKLYNQGYEDASNNQDYFSNLQKI